MGGCGFTVVSAFQPAISDFKRGVWSGAFSSLDGLSERIGFIKWVLRGACSLVAYIRQFQLAVLGG